MILPQLREHGADLGERLFRSYPRLQAGNRPQVVAAPVQIGRVKSRSPPELSGLRNREIFRQTEIRRHHPDDSDWIVIQPDRPAQNVRVPAIPPLPHLITYDRHPLAAGSFVFPAKSPAEDGLKAQRFEDALRHICDRDALRLVLLGQVSATEPVAAESLKRLVPGPQPLELRF